MLSLALIMLCFVRADALAATGAIPKSRGLVNDNAGILTAQAKKQLERTLEDLKKNGPRHVEVIVSIFNSLDGMPIDRFIAQYSKGYRRIFLFERDMRVHVVMVVEGNKMRIGVGRGIEDVLTDSIVKEIMGNTIFPAFNDGRYEEGLIKGVDRIVETIRNSKGTEVNYFMKNPALIILAIVFAVVIVRIVISRTK